MMTAINNCPLVGASALPAALSATARSAAARPRVLILVPCLLVGGTEMHTLLLARCLMAAGYRVLVCAYYESDSTMVAQFESSRVAVQLLQLKRGRIRAALHLASALFTMFRKYRPALVHVQYMTPGVLPVLLARFTSAARLVATIHVTANHYGRRSWLPRRIAAPACDAFLCVSQVAERSFFGQLPAFFSETEYRQGRRHFTIHNCVNLAQIETVIASSDPRALAAHLRLGGGPVIGIVGRLQWLKGHDLLLAALSKMVGRFPDIKVLCVGDGELREHLQAQATRLNLAANLIWTGRLTQQKTFEHMLLMDVVVMPSRPCLEGFGLVAAEAMAMGKPVVASNVDGLAEVVGNDGAGVLVQPNDADVLAHAITELLIDPIRRNSIAERARQRAWRSFSSELFAQRHVGLYRSLLQGR